MLITNNVDLASIAQDAGVSRIFVDMEYNGKVERQGHLDTVINTHSVQDVINIKKIISSAELLVRINPLFNGTPSEVENVIKSGADLIMLPMYKTVAEVEAVSRMIGGRVKLVPLLETKEAAGCLKEVVKIRGVDEIYIGLNDLHRSLNHSFMFEPLANGLVEELSDIIKAEGKSFGFGGIARMGEGALPAEKILSEHVRIGSSSVILSRTFCRDLDVSDSLDNYKILKSEIEKLKVTISQLKGRNTDQEELDRKVMVELVNRIKASLC